MRSFLFVFFLSSCANLLGSQPEKKIVHLEEYCPSILIGGNYATPKNFTGSVVNGYRRRTVLLTLKAIRALCRIQEQAHSLGYGLKVFDGYRPQKAVDRFIEWSKEIEGRPELKARYYPQYTREQLFQKGYIAKKSSHTRASTVDLTLVNIYNGQELDMGSRFDFFGEISHTKTSRVSKRAQANRKLLLQLMEQGGFKNYPKEWWHFTLKDEP